MSWPARTGPTPTIAVTRRMTTNERLTRPAADRVVAEEATGRGAGARTSAVSQAGCLPLFPSGTSCRYTTRGQVSSIHLYVVVGSPFGWPGGAVMLRIGTGMTRLGSCT